MTIAHPPGSPRYQSKPKLVKNDPNYIPMQKSEYINVGIIHINKSSTIIGANPRALGLLEYPFDFNLSQKGLLDVCESIDSEMWSELITALDTHTAIHFNAVFRSYRGGFVDITCLAVCEVGASVIDLFLSPGAGSNAFIDAALSRLELFDAFFATELLDINIKDKDLRYVATSQLYEKTFDFKPGEAIGKTPREVYPAKFADHVTSHDLTVLDQKIVISQIDVVPFSDKHLLVQKFPIYKNNSVQGIGVFAVDVTAMKVNEQRHIASKNKFSDYVELCTDVLWETDSEWSIRESNISDTSSVSGISFKTGSNLFEEVLKYAVDKQLFRQFIDSLTPHQVSTEIFELTNQSTIRMGVKPTNLNPENAESAKVFRGILTVLSTA